MNVAIKKIMKPFSAPVLAKRTYRELKLLKALMHENVSYTATAGIFFTYRIINSSITVDYQLERYLYFPLGRYVSRHTTLKTFFSLYSLDKLIRSYFVTELLGTDLHRLLQSRPLEKQFIQYFLYQILVRKLKWRTGYLKTEL